MDNNVTVKITADIADLQEQFAAAKSAISDLAEELNGLGSKANTGAIQDQANKTAEIARRLADEVARSDEQLALKQIAAAQQANNFELQMGRESLDQWKQNAQAEADAKLNAELAFLDKKLVADQGNVLAFEKDLEAIRAAYQDHDDRLTQIDQQYLEKKRQADQAALQDKIQSNNVEYQSTVSKLDIELKEHQISASERAQAEIALATTVKRQELAMFDAMHQGLVAGNAAYDHAMKQRQAIVDTFNKRIETANDQLTSEEAQKWIQLGNSIRSSFNSAIDGMLFQGKTFEQGMLAIAEGVLKAFLQMGENIAEDWIERQIEALFVTRTTQDTAAAAQVATEAGIAAATAYAQYAAFPPLADAMAAEAYAETMAWGLPKMATGAWDLKSDTIAQLHKGEMVVPQNFAAGLRANGGAFGGDVNMHYAPTINAREPASLKQMLVTELGEMLAWLNRQFRNGALRAA